MNTLQFQVLRCHDFPERATITGTHVTSCEKVIDQSYGMMLQLGVISREVNVSDRKTHLLQVPLK